MSEQTPIIVQPRLTIEKLGAAIVLMFILAGFGYLIHNVVQAKTPVVEVIDRTVETCRCPKPLVPSLDLPEPPPLKD